MFLAIEHASVTYPGQTARAAVDAVTLGLRRGEIGVLIGPSGCGKTSLLRAVAGLERLAAGRIRIDGEVLADAATGQHLPPEARRIGMVFQDYALFPHLSVEANVDFGIRHLPAGPRRARTQEVLDLVGLAHAARRAPHQLSGGQQQRIALARALAPNPRLLLLDEPFSSLDIDLRERLAEELRAILKQAGTTALFVTHDQMEAFAVGELIGVMNRGRLEQCDDPYALYHRPATRFVADFIGQMNFLPGTVVGGERVRLGQVQLRYRCGREALQPGASVTLGVRPEDVAVRGTAPSEEANSFPARVAELDFIGNFFRARLAADCLDGMILAADLPSGIVRDFGVEPGCPLAVSLPQECIRVFPAG